RRNSSSPRSAELEKRLTETEDTLHDYQRDVTEHFARTAELVNNLTENYRAMHEHLASSALKLTTTEVSRQLLENMQRHLPGERETPLDGSSVQAPRDWAPKRHGSKGTLSEDYGLTDSELEAIKEQDMEAASSTDKTSQ
ncbi:MAG TPA: DUF1043 family protein, partial [Cellvibrionaceae bacterium]